MELPQRKNPRLKDYDYSQNGAYFVTVCTANRKALLSKIVGQAALCLPTVELTEFGKITEKYIENINDVYEYVKVDKYVIMPDHIHLLIIIDRPFDGGEIKGGQGADRPTLNDIVRSVKVMVRKEIGYSIFQNSFYDHIIRNEQDLYETRKYIENNPLKWEMTKRKED